MMPTTPFLEGAFKRMGEGLSFSVAATALLSLVMLYIANKAKEHSKRKGYARLPGPIRLPLLGSALQMPQSHAWHTIANWRQTYGDIIQLDLLGYHIVAINSPKIARDLLDKRSSVYSDRPHFAFAGDLCEFNKSITLMKYDEPWKRQRKILAKEFSTPSSIPRYWPLQEQQTRLLVQSLLENPGEMKSQMHFRIGVIIQRILYGYTVESPDDAFLVNALVSLGHFNKAGKLGSYLVDFFPILKYVPEWAGAGFKGEARRMKESLETSVTLPYEWVKKNMLTGQSLMPNLCGTILSGADGPLSPEEEESLRWAAISSFGAALDTSASSALTFYLAMIMHPDVQKKAQAEVDAVVGTDRLPAISDRSSLPYVRSVMAEVLRWYPAVPMGIAHSSTRDDFYEGYHIPAHAIVVPNVWFMTHDPAVYDEPSKFIPERYSNSESAMREVYNLVFGFGRRVCPGMQFAEGTLFSVIATTLATCDVTPELDPSGNSIFPELVWSDGVISLPPEFKYNIKPRTAKALSLLTETTFIE
ncbi:cytochrome P450 [Ephemerocybe angulata]|uniref:Cytochrome P450 n=1 Tax=Ephemerocybe angulata TaxID=980116 RepID=A0A8H6M1I4_9AGAR|nr:cytochrome P450 [Tulosesus angulatus]